MADQSGGWGLVRRGSGRCRHITLGILGVLPLVVACGGSEDEDPTGTSTPAAACEVVTLQQPVTHFPVGETFWLKSTGDCGQSSWELSVAPGENLNDVVTEDGGYARFSPHVPGTYTLTHQATGAEVTFTSVPGTDLPFHNLNYYGSRTLAAVGGEIWVANVFRPTLSRLSAESLRNLGEVAVGSWPVALAAVPNTDLLLVAQRGSDTLGIVDTGDQRLIDAVWVGDEPSNVVVDASGQLAWVALAAQGAVAVVDLETRTLVNQIAVGADPLGLTLSPDGSNLFVATHRSGHPSRYPYEDDPVEDEQDITVINTTTQQVFRYFLDVGTTNNTLMFSADGEHLLLSTLQNDTEAVLGDDASLSFEQEVIALDPLSGNRVGGADLSRQASSGGEVVSLHGMAYDSQGHLWVVAEGSDLALQLEADTFAERGRFAAPGRPRDILALGGRLYVHGQQGFVVSVLEETGEWVGEIPTGEDPRPQAMASGMRYFTGAGRDYGDTWSCNSCHVDGLGDTLIWNAGPFEDRVTSRPFFWLEGTWPLGWAGYLSNYINYAYTVNTNVGIRPTTDEAQNLAAYLGSIMPPPASNGYTERDGSLSEGGLRGKEIYDGKAACASCHPMPLSTNRQGLSEGITSGASDIPALVGAYRHNVWLKYGDATTYPAAINQAVDWLGVELTEAETSDLVRYLLEMTSREFFLLNNEPHHGASAVATDREITLTLSHPAVKSDDNLGRIHLVDNTGAKVAITASFADDLRHLTLVPERALEFSQSYAVVIDADFEALNGRTFGVETQFSFTTAAQAELRMDGDYVWTVNVPAIDFEAGGFDPSSTFEVVTNFKASTRTSGADLVLDFNQDLVYPTFAVVDGDVLRSAPLPIPLGPSFSDSSGMTGQLIDEDGDGIADYASGTLTMTGPGFVEPDVTWEMTRPLDPNACEEGSSGTPAVTVTRTEGGGAQISWATFNALGVYVTDPAATLPLGPTQTVGNGNAYWVVSTEVFPAGFAGPVTYGVVPEGAYDDSERNGAPAGGAVLETGKCYKFSVTGTNFATGQVTMRW